MAHQTDDAVALPLGEFAGMENVGGSSGAILEIGTILDFQVNVFQIDSTSRGEMFGPVGRHLIDAYTMLTQSLRFWQGEGRAPWQREKKRRYWFLVVSYDLVSLYCLDTRHCYLT